jgi:nitrate reductase gamma subunit
MVFQSLQIQTMEQNSFAPPKSRIVDLSASNSVYPPKYLIIAIVVLFVAHMAIFANSSGLFFELFNAGAIRPLGILSGLIADIILFVGIVLLLFKRYTKSLFFVATAGLLLTCVLMWGEPLGRIFILITYGSGVVAAFLGWWTAFKYKRRVVDPFDSDTPKRAN